MPLGAAFLWLYVALKNSAAARPKSLTTQAPNQINDEELPQNPWPLVERVVAAIVLVVFGVIAGLFVPLHPHRFMAFGVAVPFCLLFAMRLHRVSSEHDIAVAKTVLNDFLVEPPAKTPGEDKAK